MAIITSGKTFANGEQLSASKLNQVITAATFNQADAVDGSTMTLIGGAMAVADEGIATAKIADSAVTKAKIENVANMKALGNTSGSASSPQEVAILDEDTMSSNSATSLATQQSIKAYVTAMRPKFVPLTGGTTALTKTNQGNGTTVTYNIADFTSSDSDFATSKITGLIVRGLVAAGSNSNIITASLPDGSTTTICRVVDTAGGTSDAATTLIPINSDTSTFSFAYVVGSTAFGTHIESAIQGAIIQPGL
tara:strand:+ start:287 stop:1039 length:753 start_codon:yes stop_codon:yes gene_type:complete